jgi:hypothetical protein
MPRYAIAALFLSMSLGLVGPALGQKAGGEAAQAQAAFLAAPPWRAFVDGVGGEWTMSWCAATGTPSAIWGSGLPLVDWRENSLAEARRHAHRVLREQAELLGLGASDFRETIGARMGRVWTFTFEQHFRGLPVIGGRADVRVHMAGRVPMFGAKAWPLPASFDVAPAFDADTAAVLAWQQVGAPTGVPQPAAVAAPRLVVWGDVASPTPTSPRLCWEVAVSNVDEAGAGPIGRWYIDAKTGAAVRFVSDKHECGFDGCAVATHGGAAAATSATSAASLPPVNTTVTVQGWTRTGVDAFSALTNAPLPGLQLNVPGLGMVTTDANGQFTINISTAVNVSVGALDGRHHQPLSGPNGPSGSFTVNPGVATTIQLLTSAATANEAAHTSMTYWIDRTNEYARSILGNSPELATASNIAATVNIAATCNAYYVGNTINFYQAGGGCSNTANATVIAHEWGHGIDERYGGISQTDGLSEGWGDIVGMYLCDTPNLGSGFQTAGVPLRSGNNTLQYPTGGGVHTQGQTWMGFAWKLRERLATTLGSRPAAIALTNAIVVGTLAANATNQADAVLQVYLADDNDGNLANGTPHKADLDWACNQHSLPIPGSGGPTAPANNECAAAITLGNGVYGPYTTVGATTSSPSWPCAAGGNDVWFTYNVYQNGTLTVKTCGQAGWDTAIQVFAGGCGALTSVGCNDDSCALQSQVTVNVTPGTYSIRVGGYAGATGVFSLDLSGPTALPAAVLQYGVGCYDLSRAFYEDFAAATFDLAATSMRLSYNSAGYYVASAAGAYVPPPASAQTLTLGDDTATSVTLATALTYPGGTTSTLEVCSNGFVSAAPGNGTSYTPNVASWLGSTQARWGCWHDWNPGAAGSGAVKFHQSGAISYVTWDGVYSFGTTSPGTFQLQIDRATGNVTYAWGPVVVAGNSWLVGFAAAQPNSNPGNRDISATLPVTFRTAGINLSALTLSSTLPTLGSTLTLTTINHSSSANVGIQILGTTRIDPGVDLGALGMPGCYQYAAPESLTTIVVSGGSAAYTMSIPNDPILMGFQIFGQTLGFAIGANQSGLVTSNGVALTLGV